MNDRPYDPMLPPGTSDCDPYFDDGENYSHKYVKPEPPKTVAVWCVECQSHWRAPATRDYWIARSEPCPKHRKKVEAA